MRAALALAKLGWRVLPVRAGGKIPLLKDWPTLASCDADTVEGWIEEYPGANFGVATGSGSGFFVLDVDPRHGGDDALAALEDEFGPLPDTAQASTPSGGAHYLFAMPDFAVTNSASSLGDGLDIRGEGGQIVVAPSSTDVGSYRWTRDPWSTPIAPAPAWLLGRLGRASTRLAPILTTERGYFPPASSAVIEEARAALERHGPAIDGQGGGLHTVHAAAILTHDFALSDEEALPLFEDWNETCEPPWETDGGSEQDPDLSIMLGRGARYGKLDYGCRRVLDSVETARKLIKDWQTGERNEPGMWLMVERVRKLPFDDSLKRERVIQDLKAATGFGAMALAIPKAVKRAAPKTVSEDGYDFDTSATGVTMINLNNAKKVLKHDRAAIWYDQFAQRICSEEGEWSDIQDINLALEMQEHKGLLKMTSQVVNQAVISYAHDRARDPVREWLEEFTWDGTARIAGFLSRAFGAEDSEYMRAASSNFWKSLVARPLSTGPAGCKVDTMIVLEGVQGLMKSSALKVIAGSHLFAESSESPENKDFFLALQGKLIVEIGEFESFSRADIQAVKRVLSCQVDRYRAPYERSTRDWPRRGIFVATTNINDWNRDDTGARRFWPVACERVDLKFIATNREQLFAEAVHRVNAGESWWEMPDEETKAQQEERRQADPWETLIGDHLASLPEDQPIRVVDVLSYPLNIDAARMGKGDEMRVARILKRIGWTKRERRVNGAKSRFWTRSTQLSG